MSLAQTVPSYNIELLSNVPLPAGESGNDCWGYVDSDGTEYAIIGSTLATYIYSLEDPSNPILRSRIPGVTSTWRDIKDHNEYLYVTADRGTAGVLVINMEDAPTNITSSFFTPTITVDGQTGLVGRSHNLYITDEGYMVLSGSDFYSGTPLFFDLNVDPEEPAFLGASRNTYAHDVFAENNKLYSSDIYEGEMTVHDYSDPTDIQALGSARTSTTFTHNAWPTDDDASAFTTDERKEAFVDAFDVSDPTAIRFLDKFRPDATFENESIPHNTHVLGDYLATSWYQDGVVLTDVSRPNNMVEVGIFDTFEGPDFGDGFDGCWGTYPFLPSGLLIASDISKGLYVFQPTYEKGCYFEGTVVDSVTRDALSGVEVNFDNRAAQADISDVEGKFETGIYTEGTYPVTFSKLGYASKTIDAVMSRGVLNLQTVELLPITLANLSINVVDQTGTTIPNGQFVLNYVAQAANNRLQYELIAGAWGFITKRISDVIVDQGSTETITIMLEPGVYDDYIFDFGWVESGTATSGKFERGVPLGTSFNGSPSQLGFDLSSDFGAQALVTGNTGGNAGDNDVDGGTTTITSPVFDLSSGECSKLEFWYHFFNDGGNSTPDDALEVSISNGSTSVVLETFTASTSDWTQYESGKLSDLITLTNDMTVSFTTSDLASSGHLVEAMIDQFSVTAFAVDFESTVNILNVDFMNTSENSTVTSWDFGDGNTSTMTNPSHMYATPGTYTVTITIEGPCGTLGQGLLNYNLTAGNTWNANVTELPTGTYYLSAPNQNVTPISISVIR